MNHFSWRQNVKLNFWESQCGIPGWEDKNCQMESSVERRDRSPLKTSPTISQLFSRTTLVLSVCVLLFFRSTSLSWKSSPTLQMQLPMLLQPWWSFWLPGAECQKTEVGKQLKSSWERYQTPWQDENLNFGIQCYSYAWQHKVFRSKEIIFLFTEYNGLYVL